jgi:outer membrane protein TolC
VKKSFMTLEQVGVAALAVAALASPARAQAPSDARVKELLAQAQAQVQQLQAAQAAPQAPAPAGQTIDLTMDQAVAKAVDQNIDLTVARLSPQIQDLTYAQARGFYIPTLTGGFGQRSATTAPANIYGGGSTVNSDTMNFSAGLSQALPFWGGNATLNWTNSRLDSTNHGNTINPQYQSNLVAQLVQPLFRNRSIDTNRQSLQTAEINRRLADVSLRSTTINTVANTRNAYWDLVYATQAVDAARQSLALAQKLVEDNRSRVEIGTMAPIDVVSAQSEAASRQLALVQAIANRQTAEITLKRLLVAGTTDPLWNATLNPVDRPAAAASDTIDVESALRKALAERTDLIQARENLKISDISMRYLKNQTMPGLDLTASYAAAATAGPVGHWSQQSGDWTWVTDTPGGYWDALRMIQNVRLPTWNLAVQFSYPIGNSAQEANYARSKVQYEQSLAQVRSLELRVATDVTNASLAVNNNLQQVQASGASRELAQKKLEAAQSKFEVGMATNYEVVQAQRDLNDAVVAELRAILNYRKSLVDFQRLQETSSSGSSGVSSVGTGSTGGSSTGGAGSGGSGSGS